MGYSKNIGVDRFPQQGQWANKIVCVRFHDEERTLRGKVVRDDIRDPYVMIILLEDGRHVLATECVYSRDTAAVPRNTVCTCPVLDGHEVTGSSCPVHGLPPAPFANTRGGDTDSANLGAAIANAMEHLSAGCAVQIMLWHKQWEVQALSRGRLSGKCDGELAEAISNAVKWTENAG